MTAPSPTPTEIAKCPICGLEPSVHLIPSGRHRWPTIICNGQQQPGHQVSVSMPNAEDCVAEWNRRPAPETQAVAWRYKAHEGKWGYSTEHVITDSEPLYRSPVESVPVRDGYRMAQVPKDMTDADIEGWRRNRALEELLKDAPPLA